MNYKETNLLLETSNICLSFDDVAILENVNLQIKDIVQTGQVRGQIRCLLGPSGIGKTLFLKIMAGLLKPDVGHVRIAHDGLNLKDVAAGDVGVVFQDYTLFDHLTVIENLVLGGKVSGNTKSEAKQRANELLEHFNLNQVYNSYPGKLSGGQKQRVAVIQQIMVNKEFILMDEPFSGLDPGSLKKIMKLIREIATSSETKTIIFTTHDISAAVQMADFIHIMGRQYDSNGNQVQAAHIIETISLLEKGIAWVDNNRALPKFRQIVNEIEDKFENI